MKSINVEINGNFSSLSFDFKHEFDSGITTLLGHIGSGKSTIVDSISGFNRQLKSIVNINGNVFDSHIPSKINLRPISVMFQDTRLIPHMNVKENISFALKKSKIRYLILLGDRYEIFCAAVTAHMKGIKVVHLHGGELTLGAYDDAYRHSITKFSYLHFTASKNYRKRVIQLGENPRKVFNVGPLARESISHVKFLKKSELEKRLKLKLKQNVILATFHPEIGSEEKNKQNLMNFIHVLGELENVSVLFTSPNLDFLGNEVKKLLKEKIRDFGFTYFDKLGGV